MNALTEVQAGYDLWAKYYDVQRNVLCLLESLASQLKDQLLHEALPHQAKVLDLCCGTGRSLDYLESRFGAISGFDLSEKMLKLASAKKKAPDTQLFQVNLRELADRNDFDLVHSSLALMHFSDQTEFFTKSNRLLKNGGIIYVTDAAESLMKRGSTPNFDSNGKNIIVDHTIHATKDLKRSLGETGFQILASGHIGFDETLMAKYSAFKKYLGMECLHYIMARKESDV